MIAFVHKKHPNVFMAGCCLHLVHIAAEKGAVCLPGVDDVLVDIFHYFKKSAKRQCEFANMQEQSDVEQKCMLKHVCTNCPSMNENDSELVIEDAARAFIADATNNGLREKRVKAFHGDVKRYFTSVCCYMIAKLPLNEQLLRHVGCAGGTAKGNEACPIAMLQSCLSSGRV